MYRLHRETFYLATDFIDRYLAKTEEEVPKTRLQLLGVTCLFVAAKVCTVEYRVTYQVVPLV